MKPRRKGILKSIVQHFISTANPVGSQMIHKKEEFSVSAATIRNEMAALEKQGLLQHPHTSAGRVPTPKGYRFYVDELEISTRERQKMQDQFSHARSEHYREKLADQRIFDAVAILTKVTPNIAFSTVPSASRTFFLGLSNALQEPEFSENSQFASRIVKVLEEEFSQILEKMEISTETSVFIGSENFLDEFDACTLIAFEYEVLGKKGKIGILGPMRMPYKKNILALEMTRNFLNEKFLES